MSIQSGPISCAKAKFLRLSLLTVVIVSAGCTIIETQPPARVIEPQVELPTRQPVEAPLGALRIVRPGTDQTRDSRRMLVRRSDSTLQALAQHVWLDNTPDMLRGLMVRSLEHSNAFIDVHTGGPSQWLLASEIHRFEATDLDRGDVAVEIELQLRLLQQHSGKIVSSQRILAQVPAAGNDTPDIVRAFEQALAEAMTELTEWTIDAVQAQAKSSED